MFVIRYLFDLDNKKTWTLFVYVLEVSPNTLAAYSTSPTPNRREHPYFYSCCSFILAKFQEQDSSGRFFVNMFQSLLFIL